MTAARKTEGDHEDFVTFQVDIGKLKYQMEALSMQGDRQEKKIDEVKNTLDKLAVVTSREFLDHKDAMNARFEGLDNRYVRLESVKGIKAIALAVGIALATAVALGLARLLGADV